MKNYTRTKDFKNKWNFFYKIITRVSKDIKNKNIDIYTYSLYDRSLYLYDAYVLIEKTNNISAMTILLRSLYEIKIKASKLQDNKDDEISHTNAELQKEFQFFLKKIEKGTSYSSQILWKIFKDIKYNFHTKDGNNRFKRRTIKDNADKTDLGFDYEISYWLSSLFIHSHPLSLMIEHKDSYPKSEIVNYLSHISTDIDLLNINLLGTMLWITQYLFTDILSKETKEMIKNLWDINRKIIEEKYNIKWEIDKNIPIGTLKIGDINLKRPQRK
jgi:hypothetical protein